MADVQTTRISKKQKRRRKLFFLVMMLLVYCACEGIAYFGLHTIRTGFKFKLLRDHQQNIAEGTAASDGATEVIHPYVGWVHNPQLSPGADIFDQHIPVNSLGFLDSEEAVHTASDDEFILGIAGGSVAWQLSIAGEDILKNGLQDHPAAKGKRIRIVRMAQSGYKQPQQLMTYNYISVLGGHFDAVINIDGYNEAALAVAENGAKGCSVAYPRAWHVRVIATSDPRSFEPAERLLTLRAHRQSLAKNIISSSLNWSPLRNLIWHFRDESTRAQLNDFGLKISKLRKQSFTHKGPFDSESTPEDIDSSAIDLWLQSSIQLHKACAANGTFYLHVLQPNHYLEGSKPNLSAEEKETFYAPTMETSETIARLYPQMRDRSKELTQHGVAFTDQTQLFVNESDTIYCDAYCHYNKRGNEILSAAVLDALLSMMPNKRVGSVLP